MKLSIVVIMFMVALSYHVIFRVYEEVEIIKKTLTENAIILHESESKK
jgi:hypothetical protein